MMRDRRRAIVLLVIGVLVPATSVVRARASEPPEACTMFVTLFDEAFSDKPDVPAIPLTFDPMARLQAVVWKVIHGRCPVSAGQRAEFLIHSPTLTFNYGYDKQEFFLTIQHSDTAKTGRKWDLVAIDRPLTSRPPSPYAYDLLCSCPTHAVRVAVGTPSRFVIGPLTVFQGDVPVVSLGTWGVDRVHPHRASYEFSIEYPGDLKHSYLRPPFRFKADHATAELVLGSLDVQLSCQWPPEAEPTPSWARSQ